MLSIVEESDLPAFQHISNAAFSTGIASKLCPHPITPEKFAQQVEKQRHSLLHDKGVHYLKIIDTDITSHPETGQLIAGAKWRINLEERSEEEVESSLPKPPEGEMAQERGSGLAEREFITYLANSRREWMGGRPFFCGYLSCIMSATSDFKAHLLSRSHYSTGNENPCHFTHPFHPYIFSVDTTVSVLHLLITHPAHRRRGAGSMLIDWGLKQADVAGLPTYLEASPMGLPLYERWGFEPRKKTVFELDRYGGKGVEVNTAMIRPFPAKTGI